MNNLEVYLRDIFDAYDEKKFGKIQVSHMVEALKKCEKIKLTKAQIYVLENIVPKDSKNEINYIELSKLLAEIIKKFYICKNAQNIGRSIEQRYPPIWKQHYVEQVLWASIDLCRTLARSLKVSTH